jgi:tetratricopeptide (TPR) repeat protein
MTPVQLKEMYVPKVHKGLYLICRTIIPPRLISGVTVLLQDTRGDIESASFYYFQESLLSDPNEWLPEGTILLIKEPYMKYQSLGTCDPMIRVDSPSDVIFLHESDNLLRSTKWHRPVHKTFEELKADGNRLFWAKNFAKAIQVYDLALQKEPGHPAINLNKAVALLSIERYHEAYQCALLARGNDGVDQGKVELWMGRAAYGLREWSRAVEHFASLIGMKPDLNEAKELLDKANRRLEESRTGQYDMHFLVRNSNSIDVDVADFVGPVEIAEIPGKGRGLVTMTAVSRGTLLLVSKAFAFADPPINLMLMACDIIRNVIWPASQYLTLVKSVQKLLKNPQLTNDLYSLFSGESDRGVTIPGGVTDTARIERIHGFNAFGAKERLNVTRENQGTGLWILPSCINHSCIGNVNREHYGDVMMVHAIRDLSKGEELLWPYHFSVDFDERTKQLLSFCFTCKCPLCVEERSDPTRQARMRIYSDFIQNKRTSGAREQERVIASLQKKYPPANRFQLQLCEPFFGLARSYWRTGKRAKAADAFEKALEAEAGVFPVHVRALIIMDLTRLFHEMGQEDKTLDRVREALDCIQVWTGVSPNQARSLVPEVDADDYIRLAVQRITAQ